MTVAIVSVNPNTRLWPGMAVTLTGSGFVLGCHVLIEGQPAPKVRVLDDQRLKFILTRPAIVSENVTGDVIRVRVQLPSGDVSNELELALDTFRMVVVGDSILWGQGLTDDQKCHSIVARRIQDRLVGVRVVIHHKAHSGAIIGAGNAGSAPRFPGEVPKDFPTILQQCDEVAEDNKSVNLVLLDGGINDIGVGWLLSPAIGIGRADRGHKIEEKVHQYCLEAMTDLLTKATGRFENAVVVVTGYYAPVSNQSDLSKFTPILTALGVIVGGVFSAAVPGAIAFGIWGDDVLREEIGWQAGVFAASANASIRAAVAAVNDCLDRPRVFFADPGFGPENSVHAPSPWLWGFNADGSPQDEAIRDQRAAACNMAYQSVLKDVDPDYRKCMVASLGHPNPRGAQVYADAVWEALTHSGLRIDPLPLPTVTAGPDRSVGEGEEVNLEAEVTNGRPSSQFTWDWGDGSPSLAGTLTTLGVSGGSMQRVGGSHAWADDGTYTVTAEMDNDDGTPANSDGTADWDDLTVTVNNVPPTITHVAHEPVQPWPGQPVQLTAPFTDPGWLDTHTATIDWGDGSAVVTGTVSEANNPPRAEGTVVGEHHYAVPATYTIGVSVTDDDGGVGHSSGAVRVELSPDMPGILKTDNELTFLTWVRSLPGAMGAVEAEWRDGVGVPKIWWIYEADGWLFFFQKTPGNVPNYKPRQPADINRNFLAIAVPKASFQAWFWGSARGIGAWVAPRTAESRDHIFAVLRALYS